jgi:hypothetical protein
MSSNTQKIKNIRDTDTNTEPKLKLIDPNKNKNVKYNTNNGNNNSNNNNLTDMKCSPTNVIVQDPATGQYQKLYSCIQ